MNNERNNELHENPAGSLPDMPMLIYSEGHTTYIIGLHTSEDARESFGEKVKRLIRNDVKNDNF